MIKRNSNKRVFIVLVVFAVIAVLFIFYLITLSKITTVFNITASTERIEFTVVDNNNSALNFYGVNIVSIDSTFEKNNFSGFIKLEKGDRIKIDRTATGPAIISIENLNEKSVGRIQSDEEEVSKVIDVSYIEIEIPDIIEKAKKGITHALPFKGLVKLGGDIDFEINGESTGVLKEGTVTMQGFNLFQKNEYFQAGIETLKLGDELSFEKNELGFGFALIGEKPGIDVSYRIEAEEATIIKPGPVKIGYKISATLLDLFLNDKTFQALSVIFGFILIITSLSSFSMSVYSFVQKLNSK